MPPILKNLALLFAGALTSGIISAAVLTPTVPSAVLWLSVATGLFLVLLGSDGMSKGWHACNLWRRRGKTLRVGILNDMHWDAQNDPISAWANVSPTEWKAEIERGAREHGKKVRVKLINLKQNLDSYRVVLNPYGGVYPEHEMKDFGSLGKIFDYVNEGGLFVNVADIPGYWAYNTFLKRRMEATHPVYGMLSNPDGRPSILHTRPFELVPFMLKLGLRVRGIEATPMHRWNVEFGERFTHLGNGITLEAHRAVVVERNVEPVISPKNVGQETLTPLFFVGYGNGKFLISLFFLDPTYPENSFVREGLPKLLWT